MSCIFMRFPQGLKKALTFSYDDGVEQDKRLVEIFDANGLRATFNINTGLFAKEGTVYPSGQVHRRMTQKECLALYKAPHEVAVHGLMHPFWNELSRACATYDIAADRANIEKLFCGVCRGAAYPYGTFNDEVVASLLSCGIEYCRTTVSTHSFDIPKDPLRLDPTCHHNDNRLFGLCEKFVSDDPRRAPYLFYVWGHSYEFEANDNWRVIEEFAEKIGGRSDVWYATNIEIFDYVRDYRRLEFSLDCSFVHNPTAKDIWFDKDGKTICVKCGKTIKI